MYVLIDNYDSFTYNIYQYLLELTDEAVEVLRSDAFTFDDIDRMSPRGIIISPGPGRPEEAGMSVEIVKRYAASIPILGICLGHQAIGYAFGAEIVQAKQIVHGKAGKVFHDGQGVFRSIPSPGVFTRYHSLVIKQGTLPEDIEVTATSEDREIMGIRHRNYPVEGVQFHPESMASEYGMRLLKNFLVYKRRAFAFGANLEKIMKGEDLSPGEAGEFMEELTEGNLTPAQVAGYLTAFNGKGITAEEIAGCAGVLQRKRLSVKVSKPLLDTCGTGGDGLGTFNISSMAAIAASACGAVVAKHGNRAVSSVSGSADFYRALGIAVDLPPEKTARCIEAAGFGFLFAPMFHGAMRFAAEARRDLGIKTLMNLLGPLVNPAGAEYQLIGVFSEDHCLAVAEAAKLLGLRRVLVVHGRDGMDEISINAPTRLVFADENGNITDSVFHPAEAGITGYTAADVAGGSARENAETALCLMRGQGPRGLLQAVALNAGAALYVYGLAESIRDGYAAAADAFRDGKVLAKFEEIRRVSGELEE